jgi:cobalt-zinc-cadmium efflux system outer membrane protein
MCLLVVGKINFGVANAQDTLKLNYKQAEAILLKENITLMSAHYDVEIAQAQAMQAKAWNNLYLNWNQDLYSVERNEYFNQNNQRLVQVDYNFSIAGKYTNTVRLAKVNTELNELMLQDVVRSLIFELGQTFNSLNALQKKQVVYQEVLTKYRNMIAAGQKQLEVGAIAGNEVVRLRSEQIALETVALDNTNQIIDVMSELRKLLAMKPGTYLQTENEIVVKETPLVLTDLYAMGADFRPDYKLADKQITYSEINLKLQKSIAFPDVTVGYQPHDKGSNYVRPYTGLVVEFELPTFNRNKGNIKAASSGIRQAELEKKMKGNELDNEINSAYIQWLNTQVCLANYTDAFMKSVEELNYNANLNYNKKNISLLAFIDLQRIYLENKLQFIELSSLYQQSGIRLNFTVGKEVVNQ